MKNTQEISYKDLIELTKGQLISLVIQGDQDMGKLREYAELLKTRITNQQKYIDQLSKRHTQNYIASIEASCYVDSLSAVYSLAKDYIECVDTHTSNYKVALDALMSIVKIAPVSVFNNFEVSLEDDDSAIPF